LQTYGVVRFHANANAMLSRVIFQILHSHKCV